MADPGALPQRYYAARVEKRRGSQQRENQGVQRPCLVAAVVNLWCLRLLNQLKNKDVNLRATTTFSFNDFVSNGGIVLAGIAVMLTGANWPDLIVGIAVACIAIYGGIEILRDAHKDTHE